MFFLMVGLVSPIQAYTFYIDDFTVTKNSTVFQDTFEDGNPPPSAPGFPQGYSVVGVFGPENEGAYPGRLTIDSAGAVTRLAPNGQSVLFQGSTLNTNVGTNAELRKEHELSVTGLFDFDVLSDDPVEFYGVRFSDRATGAGFQGNDVVGLQVFGTSNGAALVRFQELDFVSGTVDILEEELIAGNHDQIGLSLSTAANSLVVKASYWFIDNGVQGAVTTFNTTVNIFEGEDWTRAQFLAGQVVPIPAALPLFLSALGMMGFAGWKRKKTV